MESRCGRPLPACGCCRFRTGTHIPVPRTVSAHRLLISSLWVNRHGTVFRSSTPLKPRLPVEQMHPPLSFFHHLAQLPADPAAHMLYTGLVFPDDFSHIYLRCRRRTEQPFSGCSVRLFMTRFATRTLFCLPAFPFDIPRDVPPAIFISGGQSGFHKDRIEAVIYHPAAPRAPAVYFPACRTETPGKRATAAGWPF